MDEVSLRDYLDSMLTEHRRMHDELAKGIEVALQSVDSRLASMNEFRAALNDLVRKTVDRATYEASHSANQQRIDQVSADLRDRLDQGLATANKHLDREVFDARAKTVDERFSALDAAMDARLKSLENWRSRAAGASIVLTLFAGIIGAAVVRALGG